MNDGTGSLINQTLECYNKYFGINETYLYEIFVSGNLFDKSLEFCQDAREKLYMIQSKDKINVMRANVIAPKNNDRTYYILLHENNLRADTLAHEYTHVIDLSKWDSIHSITDLRMRENIPHVECFNFYKELRGFYRGELFICSRTKDINIQKSDLEERIVYWYEHYKIETSNPILLDNYAFAKFYGRFLAVTNFFEHKFELPNLLLKRDVSGLLNQINNIIDNSCISINFDLMEVEYNNAFNI